MSLHDLTSAELTELRKRIISAALKMYQGASELTRAQSALPELRTIELIRQWQGLRDSYAVAISAAQEQFELLEDIAREFARRNLWNAAPLESYDETRAIEYIENGNADA